MAPASQHFVLASMQNHLLFFRSKQLGFACLHGHIVALLLLTTLRVIVTRKVSGLPAHGVVLNCCERSGRRLMGCLVVVHWLTRIACLVPTGRGVASQLQFALHVKSLCARGRLRLALHLLLLWSEVDGQDVLLKRFCLLGQN